MPSYTNPPVSLTASVGVESHPGRTRQENQDRISRAATPYGDLYLLADGVGGHKGGAQAAQYVVDGFAAYMKSSVNPNAVQALKEAASSISSALRSQAATSPELEGMSSTVVLALVNGTRVVIGHAGDSRAYLIRDQHLQQLTRDHSVMQRLMTEGHLTPQQAAEHPDASVLTHALGQRPDVELETLEFDLVAGDALLLCSDGLWGYAAAEDIQRIVLSPNLTPSSVAEALLSLALNGGGGDNVSIQFIRFQPAAVPLAAAAKPSGNSKWKAIGIVSAAALLVGIGGGMAISNYRHPIINPLGTVAEVHAHPTVTPTPPASPPVVDSQPKNPSGRTEVVVISFGPINSRLLPKLKKLAYVTVNQQPKDVNDTACYSLMQDKDMVYYSKNGEDTAKKMAKDISINRNSMAKKDPEDLVDCFKADILVVPGSTQPLKDGIDNLKKGLQKLPEPKVRVSEN